MIMPVRYGQKGVLMKSISRTLITTALAAVMVFGMSTTADAADSGTWHIDYGPGAPSAVSNQLYDVQDIEYYSGGYYANCKTLSGDNGRALTITSVNAGGMDPVSVTTTGTTRAWRMKGSTRGTITFRVTATSGFVCKSTGIIRLNN